MKTEIYIQGDVVLRRVSELPMGDRIKKSAILAYGELTGHRHELVDADGAEVFSILNKIYVTLSEETTLRHGKQSDMGEAHTAKAPGVLRHLDVQVPPGSYEVIIQRETDHYLNETRRVTD